MAVRWPTFRGRPLLAASVRWPAGGLIAMCAIVIAVLGSLTAHQSQADSVDARIDAAIIVRLAPHMHAANLVVELGNQVTVTIICALLVLACLALRRPRGAVLIAVSVVVASGLTESVLKPLFGRTLGGALSFPSGHETGVSSMAVAVIVLLAGPARPRLPAALRWLLMAVAAAAVIALSPALVAVHYHYFSDTIGGLAVGTGTVLATALVVDALTARLTRARAARTESEARTPAGAGMTTAARGLPPA